MDNIRDEIIQNVKEKFEADSNVIGLVLAGSSFNNSGINKNSDIDFVVVTISPGGQFEFYHDKGIWVEIFYEDEERIKKCFEDNDEIMINCFKDGRILIDNKGLLGELKKSAMDIVEDYEISDYNLKRLKYRLQVILLKIKNAYLKKDLDKLIFLCMYVFPHLIRGLYIINHKIPPTLGLWYDRDRILKLEGGDLLVNLFEAIKNSSSKQDIDEIYNIFMQLNNLLDSKTGGAFKGWKDKRKEHFQTFL